MSGSKFPEMFALLSTLFFFKRVQQFPFSLQLSGLLVVEPRLSSSFSGKPSFRECKFPGRGAGGGAGEFL